MAQKKELSGIFFEKLEILKICFFKVAESNRIQQNLEDECGFSTASQNTPFAYI